MKTTFANFDWPRRVEIPKTKPRTARHVATVEWAWGPAHSRQDAYHISTNRKRTHWILWTGYFDDNETFAWQHMPYAYGPKVDVRVEDAARELLRAGWTGEVEQNEDLDQFHFIYSEGLLSAGELLEIAEEVWGEKASSARRLAAKEREAQTIRQLFEKAEKGNPSALNKLAACHFFGTGVKKSRKQAVELWMRSARSGHARARFNLAICYRDGFGVPKNEAKALKLYEDLAREGYYGGLKQAAYCRRVGIGTKPDLKKAIFWNYQLARARGPQNHLFVGLVDCLAAGTGRTKLEREVMEWLEHDAKKNVASRNMLASLKEKMGKSTPPLKWDAGIGYISADDDMLKLDWK